MSKDTSNSLTDFDMCLAVAQASIDSQMAAAWKEWIGRSEFIDDPDAEEFGAVNIYPTNPRTGRPSKFGLSAYFAPLTVSLNVPDAKLAQVEVTLHLEGGEVSFYDEFNEERAKHPIRDWSVSFITNLDKQPVDLDVLRKIDPKVAEAAGDAIEKSGLSESVFSIEYLFMKFTDVNLMLVDNKSVNIPADVPDAARTKALASLNKMLQGDGTGKFMLGTVVRRSKSRSTGEISTFTLTDFIFNVHAEPSAPEASTLAYLGMFSNHGLPADINLARLKLQDNWVRPSMIDGSEGLVSGVMAISAHSFLESYLIPKFSDALGMKPKRDGLKWSYSLNQEGRHESKDFIRREVKKGIRFNMAVEVVPGGNTLKISGRLDSYVHYNGYTLDLGLVGNDRTEWMLYDGHRDLNTEVTLTGTGGTSDFSVDVDISDAAYFGTLVTDTDDVGGFAVVSEGMGDAFKALSILGETPGEILGSAMTEMLEKLKEQIGKCLKGIDVSLKEQAFIPPGGGVFTFQGLRFSEAGDLLLDVIYKAP